MIVSDKCGSMNIDSTMHSDTILSFVQVALASAIAN